MNMLPQPTVLRTRGPMNLILKFFSSIWLGVSLIALILIYGTLGSAIPGFRQIFELTEFQYFNHTVLGTLILLFCINLTVATFRRIKFNRINAGVITVHTGLLVLCYGSVVYFGQKIEGDVWLGAPAVRIYSIDRFKSDRDNALIAQFPAVKGEVWEQNIPMLGGRHRIEVMEVRHEGLMTAAHVTLRAQAGNGPAETIELAQGGGDKLSHIAKFTERFALVLNGSPETATFYDDTTPALIIPLGEDRGNWAHFELPALPYYHERFILPPSNESDAASRILDSDGKVVTSARLTPLPLIERWRIPFNVMDARSALASDWPISIEVDGYLPYVELQPRAMAGGDRDFPLTRIEYRHGEDSHDDWLVAESPERAETEYHDGARAEFRWIGAQTTIDPAWTKPVEGRHVLGVHVKDADIRRSYDVKAGQTLAIEGTGYTLTVEELRPSWPLMTAGFQNARTPIALVVVKSPTMEYQRSVLQRFPQLNQDRYPQSFTDPEKRGKKIDATRDLVDDNIELTYVDADTHHFLVVAGENLAPTVIHTAPGGRRNMARLEPDKPFQAESDTSFTLHEYYQKPRFETLPMVIAARNRRSQMDVRRQQSAIRLHLTSRDGAWSKRVWVPFSDYNTDNVLDQSQATVVSDVPGMGDIRFIYGRAVRPLPAAMTLEQLKTEFYPGEDQAREWTSHFRYRDVDTGRVERGRAYLNNTYTIGDWTFFQSRASGDHKSWTILGVGNRRGIWSMLTGCVLIALGMSYAFAIKPILVRRRRASLAVQAGA